MTDPAQCQLSFYRPSLELIRQSQLPDGAIPWFAGGQLDPWDMVEAAMGLAIGGEIAAAWRAYDWLAGAQLPDGSFWALYQDGQPVRHRRESHHAGYLAVGLWHQWLISGDRRRLEQYWPAAVRGLEFALKLQAPQGDICWAVDSRDRPLDDALVTACSSLCKSLECALAGERLFGRARPDWQLALRRLRSALRYRPERFDRHWESKRRFSMDWFYPVLGGVYTGEEGKSRLRGRWSEFVQPALGCRCVSDRPWVTVAESCELVLALCALGLKGKAEELLSWLHRHRDEGGRYWTGYVWPDKAFWPVEKPTWTAGAVLLAADALFGFTPAAAVLVQSQDVAVGDSFRRDAAPEQALL